ncbi:MAG: tyrosine-type recombinase/integrase [Halorientalis sp.]
MTDQLEPIDPHDAVELYLQKRQDEVADTTYRSQKSRLKKFAQWCDRNDIADLNDLTGRTIHEYTIHLRNYFEDGGHDNSDGKPSPMTMQTRLSTLRVFLRFCEDIDAIREGLADKVTLPDVTRDDRRRDVHLHAEDAEHLLEQLNDYRYGRKEHVMFLLAWRTACRLGTLRALDVDDLDAENNRLSVVHRPATDTPLKNKKRGERVIALRDGVVSAIERYIDLHRTPVTDKHGRDPLFTTPNGRPVKDTLRGWLYKAQLPCYHSNDCPHGTNQQECDLWTDGNRKDCPSTVRPHDIRRGAVTKFLGDDVPETAVSDRADMSKQVLDEHYDKRSPEQKSEQRRQYFD